MRSPGSTDKSHECQCSSGRLTFTTCFRLSFPYFQYSPATTGIVAPASPVPYSRKPGHRATFLKEYQHMTFSANSLETGGSTHNCLLSTHVRNYGDVFRSSGQSQLFGGYPGQKVVKITASEGPFERGSRPLIVVLEGKETVFKFGQRTEVVGREDLSLHD
jgi:hypothetical protein